MRVEAVVAARDPAVAVVRLYRRTYRPFLSPAAVVSGAAQIDCAGSTAAAVVVAQAAVAVVVAAPAAVNAMADSLSSNAPAAF